MKVSIVTITYNAARTLQRTLDSVACQTYADIEHLIIDGASKDDTVAIAERYKAASRHTVVIQSEPDKGLYDAMNKGLQKATGDYLVFLNAGDTLYAPDTIETVVKPTANSPRNATLSQREQPIANSQQPTANTYRLGGNSCLSGDWMGDWVFDHELQVGEQIIFEDMIHYTTVKTNTFNGITHPSIAMLHSDGTLEMLREYGYEDYRDRMD